MPREANRAPLGMPLRSGASLARPGYLPSRTSRAAFACSVSAPMAMRWGQAFCPLVTHVSCRQERTKADVVEHSKAFGHVGLLFNKPPSKGPSCSSASHPTNKLQPEQSGFLQLLHLHSSPRLPNCHNPNGGNVGRSAVAFIRILIPGMSPTLRLVGRACQGRASSGGRTQLGHRRITMENLAIFRHR